MNAEAIKSRDEALALLDADLITIHDFMTLCDLKGGTGKDPKAGVSSPAVCDLSCAGSSAPCA